MAREGREGEWQAQAPIIASRLFSPSATTEAAAASSAAAKAAEVAFVVYFKS